MKPSEFRAGGANTAIHFAIGECSLGSILVARSGKGICAILLGDDPEALVRELQDRFPHGTLLGGDAGFEELVAKVVGFVEAPKVGLDLPLDVRGTAFQQRVWQALQEIPVGATASYADIARRIGSPKAVRAVAQACASNRLAVAIPCHRVVRTDGAVSGYRWGVRAQAGPARAGSRRMNALAEMPRVLPTEADAARRAASLDWPSIAEELDAQGCAKLERLLSAEQCRSVAALYPQDERFRSRVIMARHGFGRGEYKYFAYPLPDLIAGLRTALYPPLAVIANRWNAAMSIDVRYPNASRGLPRTLPQGRTDPADPASVAVPAGRLQLPASGSLRRERVPLAGGDLAFRAGSGLHRRGVRPYRAAATDAVARGGGAAAAGRRGRVCGSSSAGEGTRGSYRVNMRHGVSRAANRAPPHARDHLSRCQLSMSYRALGGGRATDMAPSVWLRNEPMGTAQTLQAGAAVPLGRPLTARGRQLRSVGVALGRLRY